MPSEKSPAEPAEKRFRLIDNPDESWREYGRTDPYFGVLSEDRYRAENLNAAALNDFFASGEVHVNEVLDIVRRHVKPNLALGDALDFGCGVGRLALPLATHFNSVTGVDISDAYIAEARRNAERREIRNVAFCETLEEAQAKGHRFDLAHSYIVFNHIPWPRGKDIIIGMFGLLREGGVLAVHVLHHRHAGPFRRAASWGRRNFLPLHWLINIGRGRPAFEPLMQGNAYPLDTLRDLLQGLGGRHFHIKIEANPDGNAFAFLFCEKASVSRPLENAQNI